MRVPAPASPLLDLHQPNTRPPTHPPYRPHPVPTERSLAMHRSIAISLSAVTLLLGLAACTSAPNAADNANTLEVSEDTILIDVRTAAEYAAGHIDGAKLLDFNGGDLAAAIPNLDPDTEYLIYCRSGNRSGQAIALMEQAGFTNLTNLESLEQAAQTTGLPIVN